MPEAIPDSDTTCGPDEGVTEKPPKGLVGVVVVNSVFLLISLTGIGFQVRAGDVSPLTIFGAVMWLCLGPALLIKRKGYPVSSSAYHIR